MPRADLLALTPDDLAAITNRGTVKRAERELEEGSLTCTLAENAGELVVQWSDGIVCRFPAGKTMHEASCTSGIVGISRHVVRSVLAYQRQCRAPGRRRCQRRLRGSASRVGSRHDHRRGADRPLSPGGGGQGAAAIRAGSARRADPRGQARGPVSRYALHAAVPGAGRPALSLGRLRRVAAGHVCANGRLGVSGAAAGPGGRPRRAAADRPGRRRSICSADQDALLAELSVSGIAGCGPTWPQRLTRLEDALRKAGLVWPAELAADLFEQHGMYQAHDARFDPLEVVALVGELLARGRAIAGGTKAVPQLLIRGSQSDRVTEIAGGRMIGLGLGVRLGRRVTTLSAYVQDADSGSLAAVERSFADPAPDAGEVPKSYVDLGGTVLSRGVTLAALSQSQLLLKSGKRTPSGRLVLPRTAASLTINPQVFTWEQLKPPAAVEDFTQLAARLAALPPSYLRPRRLTDNVYVCPVQAAEEVRFNESQQRLEAVLRDAGGSRALLVHPFHSRGKTGFNALLSALGSRGESVRFVAGHVTGSGEGLLIRPILVVIEEGDRRIGIQPLVSEAAASAGPAPVEPGGELNEDQASPLESFLGQVRFELSELLLSGVRRAGQRQAQAWADLMAQGRQLGFVRLVEPLARLAELFAARADALRWDPAPASRALLDLCVYARIASDA